MNDLDDKIRDALRSSGDRFEPNQSFSTSGAHHRARALRARTVVWALIIVLFITSGAVIATRTLGAKPDDSFIGPNAKGDPNLSIARAEIAHQLELVKLPPGAERVSSSPVHELSTGPPQSSASGNFIYTTRWWTVPSSLDQTIAWIQEHPPLSAANGSSGQFGTGTSSGPHFSIKYLVYQDRPTRAYQNAWLEISVVSLSPNISGVRADGTAVWLTSQPTPDRREGPSIRVTTAGGCPTSIAGYHDISNPRSHELTVRLLPANRPTGAIRCRYQDSSLIKQEGLDAAKAQTLARTINGLPLGSPGRIVSMGCGLTEGRAQLTEIIVFSYQGRSDIDLWHGYECFPSVANGFITTVLSVGDF